MYAQDEEAQIQVRGIRIGYASGAFDLFHIGHLNILRQARAHCDFLIAGVVADDVLEETKGRRPVIPLAERVEIVNSIGFVDRVFPETVADKMAIWDEIRFNTYFKGDDWRGTERGRRLERDFAERQVAVVYFPYTIHTSSTTLRQALDAINREHHRNPMLNGAN